LKKFLFIFILGLIIPINYTLAQDSTRVNADSSVVVKKEAPTPVKEVKVFKPNPHTAMLLTAVVPGLGQIYNQSYWKAPLVWGGFAALIYAVSWNGHYYNQYYNAYLSVMDNKRDPNAYLELLPEGQKVDTLFLRSALYSKQVSYRRNRDLSIIGLIGFYSLTILDAYVDAQLYDYDISPNLSLHVEPVFMSPSMYYNPNSVGIKCQLTF
jgi:hypothetical protein